MHTNRLQEEKVVFSFCFFKQLLLKVARIEEKKEENHVRIKEELSPRQKVTQIGRNDLAEYCCLFKA